jgi:putative membrane protein
MNSLVLRWLIITAAILISSYVVQGIRVSGFLSALLTAAILGFLNLYIRPLVIILTLPINIITLGLFTLVINALMLLLASVLSPSFDVEGFWPALLGALVISAVSWLAGALLG